MDKTEIIKNKVETLSKIHTALKEYQFFGFLSEDTRQRLMVALLIDTEKTSYFQNGRK